MSYQVGFCNISTTWILPLVAEKPILEHLKYIDLISVSINQNILTSIRL